MKMNPILIVLITLFLLLQSGTVHPASAPNYTVPIAGMDFVYVQGGCSQVGDSIGGRTV